ncbi:hypothetical protein GPALN_006590 [Globodera pallida]|nr:hypothetical protein GPALN_006590 [Globodera pallida]
MTFVSILILSALTLEVQCQNSTSDRFNSFILAITSASGDKQSIIVSDQQFVDQRPVELALTKARQLQEWIGQVAKQIVDEHELEASNYNCKPNVKFNDVIFDDVILTVGQAKQQIKLESYLQKKKQEKKPFLKLLFSFGASLSAEIGGPPHQNETNYLRSLLTAYGCVDGQLIDVEKSGSNFGISEYINIGDSMYTFDIENVMEGPLCKLVTQKVMLKLSSKHDNHKPRHIQSFSLLNALNVQLSALDVIQFAEFIAQQSEQCLKKEEEINVGPKNAKGSAEKPNIFAHYDNAIRIDWNIWNAVKQRVDELIEATNKMHEARQISQDNYKILKLMNEQQFSIYECQLARLSKNIEDNILEMLKEKNMDTKLKSYFNNWELEVQKRNTDFVKEKCETQVAESKKVELLISVRYDLVVNFEHNLHKDIRGQQIATGG